MCTCISTGRFFGRTLDVEASYDEKVVLVPRQFPLPFRKAGTMDTHHAVIGMAHVVGGYPLFYDAMNEHGLCMAGLHFPESCKYFPPNAEKDNIASFELPLWLLGQCQSVAEALPLLRRLNVWEEAFSDTLPNTPLHWLLADKKRSIAIESCHDGLQIHENAVGVLTNEPPLPRQMAHLHRFSPRERGRGLPGDFSSPARFQRAVYGKENSPEESVGQFFHMMDLVSIPKGCVKVRGRDHYTAYTCCCDREKGLYHYTTYDHCTITCADMRNCDLNGKRLLEKELIP